MAGVCLYNHFRFHGVLSNEDAETRPVTDCLFLYAQHNDEPERVILPTGAVQLQRADKPEEKRK